MTLTWVVSKIIIGLLLSEAIVWLAAPQRLLTPLNPDHPDYDPQTMISPFGIMPEPNSEAQRYGELNDIITVRHNSMGFRSDTDYSIIEGKRGVALFGDSFTYGFGNDQDETVSSYMQEILGEEYEVMNFGLPGWHLGQEYLLYKYHVAPKLKPEFAVFFVYPHDLTDMMSLEEIPMKPFYVATEAGALALQNFPVEITPEQYEEVLKKKKAERTEAYLSMNIFSRVLLRHSHLYSFITGAFGREKMDAQAIKDANLAPFRKDSYELFKANYQLLQGFSQNILQLGENQSTRIIFVYIPSSLQVDDSPISTASHFYNGFDPADFDFDNMNRFLMESWQEIGAGSIDLTPIFRQTKGKLYNRPLGHLSPEGSKVAAEAVAELVMGNPALS